MRLFKMILMFVLSISLTIPESEAGLLSGLFGRRVRKRCCNKVLVVRSCNSEVCRVMVTKNGPVLVSTIMRPAPALKPPTAPVPSTVQAPPTSVPSTVQAPPTSVTPTVQAAPTSTVSVTPIPLMKTTSTISPKSESKRWDDPSIDPFVLFDE